jgi:hypothetical protein
VKSEPFEHLLTETDISTWLTFKAVYVNFLGKVKTENCKKLIEDLLIAYQTMECNIPLRVHLLHSLLDFFRPNLGAVNDEQKEGFQQHISTMEKLYAGN